MSKGELRHNHTSRAFVAGFALAAICLPFAVVAQTPNAPSNLVAGAVSATQINLSWADNSNNEGGFKIEHSADGTNFTQIAQVLTNTTSYRNYGLGPGATYYYRVRAFNASGSSAYSAVASASTPALCPTSVIGWGNNADGELTPPAGLTNAIAIAAGDYHSLALKADGTVVGWGYNCCGQTTSPAGATGVVAIAAGGFFSLGLKSDGTVVGWGDNTYHQTNVPTLTNVVAIAAGDYHSLALKSDGTVVGWGDNSYSQSTAPNGLAGVVAIGAGYEYSVALKSDGSIVAWGYNGYGEGASPGVTNAVAIAAGLYHSLAIKSDGTVIGWGYSGSGATTPPAGLTNAAGIGAGFVHSLGIQSDSTVVCWGDSSDGDLIPPAGLNGVIAVDGGVSFSLALAGGLVSPSTFTASAVSSSQINLTWSYSGITQNGFKIERAPDNGGSPGTWTQIVTVAANITNYTDAGLTTNTTYWYRLRAYNACTDSPYSTQVNVATAPPPAPLTLTATASTSNQVSLSWSSTYQDEAGFKIERAPDNSGSPGTWTQIAVVGASVTAYADTGLSVNATYWYRVRAYNALGDSPYSNLANATLSGGQLITVMQWNVQGHIGNILSNNTAAAKAIARIVNYNQPDVLLFCELEDHGVDGDTAGLVDWVTNNIPYLGSQTGSMFFVAISTSADGFERNGAISRLPIINETTYSDGLRGLHAFQVQLSSGYILQVYHAHLKCCSDDCSRKQLEAQIDGSTISSVAAASPLPYIFGGDWNEDENNPECPLSASYHPITTIRQVGGLVDFKPTTLDGEYRTWSTAPTTPSIRFDYILAGTNRLNPSSGYVFSTPDWASHGLYTNASPQNLVNDNRTASDHYCIYAKYFFPTCYFTVTPTNTFASTGFIGGPFSPASQLYTLTNTNSIAMPWSATSSTSWLTVSPTNGTLGAGASTNITVSVNSMANGLGAGQFSAVQYAGNIIVSNSATHAYTILNAALTVAWPPPVASFSSSAAVGAAPLTVTFSDTSTGNISGRFWNFGDGGTASTTTNSVAHTYAAGTYTVTQVETGPGGVSTNVQANYITSLTPFQAWQIQYFVSTNNPNAAPTADADGTGQNNLIKYMAGLDPTNPASVFRVVSVGAEGNNMLVTWTCVGGHAYVLQSTPALMAGGYSNTFVDISAAIVVPGVGESTTNFLAVGTSLPSWLASPAGQAKLVTGTSKQALPPAPTAIECSAQYTRGLADASGNAVTTNSLLMMGTFGVNETTIQSNFDAGNISAILSAFTAFGTPFAVGDGFGPGSWDVDVSAAGFGGQHLYLVAFDQPTVAAATQMGIFTGPSWVVPSSPPEVNFDLETATDFVIGAHGGSLTINAGGSYTFDDTAKLAVIPSAARFFRVRLVQ